MRDRTIAHVQVRIERRRKLLRPAPQRVWTKLSRRLSRLWDTDYFV